MKNNIRLGLGILTVLATPFAVDAATGSNEAHAAQDTVKSAQVAKTTNKEEVKTTTQKQVESATKTEATKVETTIKENTKVEGTKKEATVNKEEATKKEETTKKDASSDKQASSVKTVSGKPQAPEDDSTEKKSGWTSNGTYYVDGKLGDWWINDGQDWYFFKHGLKFTGEASDSAGKHYFVNGKYANGKEKGIYYVNGKVANGYANGIYYVNGKLGDWWLDDGQDWYFFKEGKKFTGVAKDSSGEHKFVNGKYAAATGNGSDGLSNVLSIAQSYLGVEMGSAEHKKIVDAYNSVNPKPVGYTAKYSDDWCDVFVTTVFQQAGLSSLIGRECGVQRHIGIMQQKGIWQGKVLPKAGDVITFDWDGGGFADHIGIVESVKDGIVTTIEGNSSPYTSSGKTKVNRKTYNWNASYIKGYARPNY